MSTARYSIFAARAVFDMNLTAAELRVLAALGTYSNGEGWCFPSQTTLAERLGLTRQTISGAIKNLVQKGYVETRVRTAKGRGKVGYDYRVVLDTKAPAVEAETGADKADIGETRLRPTPTSAPADFGEDRDPMSAQPDIPYNEGTIPSERAQQSSPVSKETEEDAARKKLEAYEAAAKAKAEAEAAQSEAKAAKAKAARKATPYTPAFEMIWLAWPKNKRRTSDKRKAFQRYQVGVEQFGAEAISAAAKRYLSQPDTRKDQWRYCCLVEVFMNGKLEAAVEDALEEAPSELTTHGTAEDRAAKLWFDKNGRWPPGYHPPAGVA